MKYETINWGSSEATVKLETGETVHFKQSEQTDGIEYYDVFWMDGYVDGKLKYAALGYFLMGSDKFENLTDIELHPDFETAESHLEREKWEKEYRKERQKEIEHQSWKEEISSWHRS